MKRIYTIITLLFFVGTAEGHFGNLRGIVREVQSNQPIEGVSIMVDKTTFAGLTGKDGHFEIKQVPIGKYNLIIGKDGFSSKVIQVTISDEDDIQLDIFLSLLTVTIPEFLVKADRSVSAASSQVLNALDFNLRPRNSAQDMLRLVPGLFIAQHAGGGKAEQVFVRGFDCDHGTDIAGFMDGIPVNMPSHGHGQGYMDFHFIIPELVKNMEVYKGPYFAKFGDFATGAAVQFNTIDVLDQNIFQMEVGSTPTERTFSSTRGLLMYQIPLNSSQINSYLAAEMLYAPGYFQKNQQFLRTNIFSKTTFKINYNSTLSLLLSGFGSSWNASGQVPDRAVQNGLISRFGSIDPSEGGTTQRDNFSIRYKYFDDNGQFETQFYQVNYRFKLFSNFTFFLEDPVRGDGIEQDDNRKITGLNTRYTHFGHLSGLDNKVVIGGQFRSDEIENQLWHQALRERLEPRAHSKIHQKSMSLFATDEVHLTEQLRIELGLRADYFIFDVEDQLPSDSIRSNYSGYNYQTLFSPKLNLIYEATDHFRVFLNSGRGFHSNDARSVVQDKTAHRLPSAWGAEIGAQLSLGKAVFSGALWGMELENELAYVGDDGTTEDKGASRRYGIDLEARVQLSSWLYFDMDLNLAKSVLLQKLFGEQLGADYYVPLSPQLTSTGGVTFRLPSHWQGSLRYRYLASRPANESNTVRTKGYIVADLSINYEYKRIRFGINVENLLNAKWNEAQFDTTSRLLNEPDPVDELHYTPGTPLAVKFVCGYRF